MSIVLTLLVKNEANRILRCLNSVIGYPPRPDGRAGFPRAIDELVVIDTGSTDGTQTIIANWATDHDIPLSLVEQGWRHFGFHLTALLELAKDRADWILRLDADMELKYPANFREWLDAEPSPQTDSWMVEVHDHGTMYRLPMLVRGGLDWQYVGFTHEYLDPIRRRRDLTGVWIVHHGDGSGRSGKLQRDRELLEAAVKEDANDRRSWFYLAQTYRDLGMIPEAIEAYATRVELGGWIEETWYAKYQAALLSEDVDALLEAWKERPHRHEPLKAAANLVRAKPHDDMLFVELT